MGSLPNPPAEGVTAEMSQWIHRLTAGDIPPEVLTRVKYQILDGVACALVGARVPWSEKLVQATLEYEPAGQYSVIGYDHVIYSVGRAVVTFVENATGPQANL